MSSLNEIQLLITIIGTIGTVTAAIAAARSAMIAEENTRITKASFILQEEKAKVEIKPMLVINNKKFEIKLSTDETANIAHEKNWETNDFSIKEGGLSHDVTLDLINLGKGYAKDIEIRWKLIDYERIIDFLNNGNKGKFYEKFDMSLKKKKEREYINILCSTQGPVSVDGFSSSSSIGLSQYYLKSPKLEKHVYLAGNQNSLKIALPNTFVCLINIYNCLEINLAKRFEIHEFPKISMYIKYKDPNENEYLDKFIIKIDKYSKLYPVKGAYKSNISLLPEKVNN